MNTAVQVSLWEDGVFFWVYAQELYSWVLGYLRLILTYISLMAKDVEYVFKCFSAIWDSSVENSLFRSVPHILVGLCIFDV